MSIKYHEYGKGYDYGTDHTLTDNWNPDADYGNEYVKVYFNIDTPTFNCMNGSFGTPSDSEKWNIEASAIIASFGIVESCGYQATTAYLYAHPQQISGVVLKNDVKRIAEAIDSMKLSSIRWVDIHETVYDISDNEYEEYLNSKRNEIRTALFQKSATPRTTKYYMAFDVASDIAGNTSINILRLQDGASYSSGKAITYILKVVKEMIDEGYLISVEKNDTLYIRSLNKTEQKKLKMRIA